MAPGCRILLSVGELEENLKKQVLAHVTLPRAFSHRTRLDFHARVRGRCCGVLGYSCHPCGFVVRPTLFWDGPKGLRYAVSPPAPSCFPPNPPIAPQPFCLTSAWSTREKTSLDLFLSLLALFIKNKLVQEPSIGCQQKRELKDCINHGSGKR